MKQVSELIERLSSVKKCINEGKIDSASRKIEDILGELRVIEGGGTPGDNVEVAPGQGDMTKLVGATGADDVGYGVGSSGS